MACLEMYNSEQHNHNHNHNHNHHHNHHCAPVSPRISFSNDFVDTQQISKQEKSCRSEAPVSSDFEFSVTNYSMMSADELFFKGRLLPFKDNNKKTTLREELLVDDEECERQAFSLRPPKGSSSSSSSSTRWKGFLGLRKSHIGSKKVVKNETFSDTSVESRRSGLVNDTARLNNITSQEILIEGGSNCREFEFGYRASY